MFPFLLLLWVFFPSEVRFALETDSLTPLKGDNPGEISPGSGGVLKKLNTAYGSGSCDLLEN
jgi:hypothetical protein